MMTPSDPIVDELAKLQLATQALDRYRDELGERLWLRGHERIRSRVWWLLEAAA